MVDFMITSGNNALRVTSEYIVSIYINDNINNTITNISVSLENVSTLADAILLALGRKNLNGDVIYHKLGTELGVFNDGDAYRFTLTEMAMDGVPYVRSVSSIRLTEKAVKTIVSHLKSIA